MSTPQRPCVVALRTEHAENPIGIDARPPRLSWQMRSVSRGAMQSAYQIRIADKPDTLTAETGPFIWNSGRVMSGESVLQPCGRFSLESMRRYFWQVRVWDERGHKTPWSPPAFWEMGLLSATDWRADWIGPATNDDPSRPQPCPLLRRAFRLRRPVQSARAYISSLGLYELYLNGRRVGDRLFTPGWTSYHKRLQYQVYDITSLLAEGSNAVGVVLGDGWYRGRLIDKRNHYGSDLATLLQIQVVYDNGEHDTLFSDASWKSATGPILASDLYDGEIYDARLEKPGWSTADYADDDWSGVRVRAFPKDVLVTTRAPPVRRIEERQPIAIFQTPRGETVADLGQNMVGWLRLQAEGPRGHTITLRCVETLDADGNLYDVNLRSASQRIAYTLKGEAAEIFEPHFTFQGFRYVAVEGYPGTLTPDRLTGVVIHSDLPRTGELATSRPEIDRLFQNIVWGQKGNFLDVPTDCPQRDERLGWTGDAQVFCATAAINMHVAEFFAKWLEDLAAEQDKSGRVPFVVPDVIGQFNGQPAGGAAGWGDAATVIPWSLYLAYGDVRILERQYESMKKWVGYEQARAGPDCIWRGDFQFGDWLDFGSEQRDRFGLTDTALIASAYLARSADIVRKTAHVLGKPEDEAAFAQLFCRVCEALTRAFVRADGEIGAGTQTAYVLALHFNLLPPSWRAKAAERLASDVRRRGHLTTGFLGTPHLLTVLSRFGYLDEAYSLLNRTDYPSWLYTVRCGATTMWERWDGIKPDRSFAAGDMNSFNHYAYGAVGEWMYRVMAGIRIDEHEPGYRHVLIEPRPGGGFAHVAGHVDTPYGRVSSSWNITSDRFVLTTEIPANTHASIRLPHTRLAQVTESGLSLGAAPGIRDAREEEGSVVVVVGSGCYEWACSISHS